MDLMKPSAGDGEKVMLFQHLIMAMDVTPIAALVVGRDGAIRHANEQLGQLFDYAVDSLLGQPLEILLPKAIRHHHPELREAFFEYPSPRSMGTGRELFGVSSSDEHIPVEIGLNPIRTDQGLFVMATVLDLRERKRHEERFRKALDAAPSAILMVDASGTIVLCNRLTEEVFGHAREALVGQPIEILIPSHLHRKHQVYRSSYAREPVRRRMGEGRQLSGVRADGSEFPVQIALQPISTSDNEQYVICSVEDISERKASEALIRQKNDDLTALNQELAAFAFSASHDLKAPLSSIVGLSQCIREDLDEGMLDEARHNLARIQTLASKLSTLVEDVLTVAASGGGGAIGELDVADGVRRAVANVEALAEQQGVHVDATGVGSHLIHTEVARLDSILNNLLSNAVRYADPNKSDKQVRVTCKLRGEHVVIDVLDNGLGIPVAMRERVFQMFERAHDHITDGSGLGLAIASKHAGLMGGTLALSDADGWTCFSLTLPVRSSRNPS